MISLNLRLDNLVRVLEAAKALKTTNIIWRNNAIYCANAGQYISYTEVPDLVPLTEFYGMRSIQLNHRELSAFIKSSADFNETLTFNEFGPASFQFVNEAGKPLNLHISNQIDSLVKYQSSTSYYLDYQMELLPDVDVTESFQDLYKATKTVGAVRCDYNGYVMYLSSNIIPLTRTDKLHITILSHSEGRMFTSRFLIKKKTGQKVKIYLSFLYIA